ncbi:MAG: hypothetical protein PUC07_06025 [Solobacterium sp.]|nr:hypothetical protein [Solobacterium sp.]
MSEKYGMTPYETREILFYKTDNGDVRVEILLYQENLWLTQAKMAELFEVQKAAISKHLKISLNLVNSLKNQLFPKWKQLLQMENVIISTTIIWMPLSPSDTALIPEKLPCSEFGQTEY